MKISEILMIMLVIGLLSASASDFYGGMVDHYNTTESINVTGNLSLFNNSQTRDHLSNMTDALDNTNPTGVPIVDAVAVASQILVNFVLLLTEVPATILNLIANVIPAVIPMPDYVVETIIGLVVIVFVFGIISALSRNEL